MNASAEVVEGGVVYEGLVLRPAVVAERVDFIELWTSLLQEVEAIGSLLATSAERIAQGAFYFDEYVDLRRPGVILGMYDDAKMVGFAIMGDQKTNLPKPHGLAYLHGVYMKPEYRNEGALTEMLGYALAILSRMGFKNIHADVLLQNKAAMHVAEKFGFKPFAVAVIRPLS